MPRFIPPARRAASAMSKAIPQAADVPVKAAAVAWYVLTCEPGKEMDVRRELRRRAKIMDIDGKLYKSCLVPVVKEEVPREGDGKMVTVTTVKYEGYVFVQMIWCEETADLIAAVRYQWGLLPRRTEKPAMPKNKEPSEAQQEAFDRWANWRPTGLESEESARLLLDQNRVKKVAKPVAPKFRAGDQVVVIDPNSPWRRYGGPLSVADDDSLTVTMTMLGQEIKVAVEPWQIQLSPTK